MSCFRSDIIPCSQFHRTEEDQSPIISNPFQNLMNKSKFEENPNADIDKEKKERKIIHREIERQRRHEMAKLYASLRSQLPLLYLKGKRSISDQIGEAVKYIKDSEKRIKELRGKRDELNNLFSTTSTTTSSSSSNSPSCTIACSQNLEFNSSDSIIISIRASRAGVELVINTDLKQGIPLSRVLRILANQGYTVMSCISAKVNQRILHTIHSEVGGGRSMDLSELERKLTDKLVTPFAFKHN